jgi:iron complex outermembrane receptor protein
MKRIVLILLTIIFIKFSYSQNSGSVIGKITDKQTHEILSGATVSIKGTPISKSTNNEGGFILENLKAGKIILQVSYVGYETTEWPVTISEGITTTANISLSPDDRVGNEVVISASKRPEKIPNAPASIQVIGKKELEQFTGSNSFELLSKVQGVEFVRTGIDHASINARGLNNAFNNKVLQIVDGRNSMTALSGGLPMHNNFSVVKDDIERIEVVLGPQTALYGPNAHNAIINFITKDPRTSQGITVALSVGNQYQFSGRIRQATQINNKWSYKFSGEYVVGKEFEFYDSIYAGGTVYGPPVAIPEKNTNLDFRHIRGEAHFYYSVTPRSDIIISTGGSNNDAVNTHTGGHLLFRSLTNSFLQGRYVSLHFFVNIYNAWANFGNSFQLGGYTRDFWNRTHSTITDPRDSLRYRLPPDSADIFAMRLGNRVKETPQRLNAEVQYNYKFEKAGLFLVAGLSYQKDKPRAYGITLVDVFQRIYVTQVGAVMQIEKKLPWQFRFIGALRWDNHSNFGNFYSPKIGLVKQIGKGNARITWGKAYSMPSVLNQYAKSNNFFGNGNGITYIPNDSKMSDSVRKTTIPLKPEQVSTWEVGYKGNISQNLYLDINYYNGLSKNFLTPSIGVGGRALYVGDIAVTHPANTAGAISPTDTLKGAQFFTVFNFGDVRVYGLDAGITYRFNRMINLTMKYSWIGSDISKGNIDNDANRDGVVLADEKNLNSPPHRVVVIVSFQNLCKQKMFVNVSTRYVQDYDFYSGQQISTNSGEGHRGKVGPYLKNFDWGSLGGFTTFDLSAGYKFNNMVSVGLNTTNFLNTEQREFAGSSLIGRIIMFELKLQVPNNRK